MTGMVVLLCTCANEEEGSRIASALVEAGLAACVNLLPGVRSIYRWQGKVEKAEEVLLLIKSREDRFPELRERIATLHSYDTPEIIALPITHGSDKYLDWLRAETIGGAKLSL